MGLFSMQIYGAALWAWIVIILSILFNFFLIAGIRAVKKRAEQLGMPVKGKDKIGVMSLLWGKSVSLKYTPTIDNNTIEIELDKKKGIKGVWSVEDIVTKPVKGLYGISAALLTYDVAHALDPEIDKELALIENADAPKDFKKYLVEKIEKLYEHARNEAYYEALLKQLEKENKEGTEEYLDISEKLERTRVEIEKIEKELSKYPVLSKLKKGEAFVFTADDGTAYVVRLVNVERIKRFAKALNPVTLWGTIKSYLETLKGDKTDFYKSILGIAVLLIVAGIVIAIILAVHGSGGINAEQLARALKAAQQPAQNVSRVVVS